MKDHFARTNEQTYRETYRETLNINISGPKKADNTLLWSLRGQYFIFGALCLSKSGLMNKHIVKPKP